MLFPADSTGTAMGITPHAAGISVNPTFPKGWKWVAVSKMPYRGQSLSMLGVWQERTLYTTVPVESAWKQVHVSAALQGRYAFHSDPPAFWMVIPSGAGSEAIAASAAATTGKLIDRETGRTLVTLNIPAGELARKQLP